MATVTNGIVLYGGDGTWQWNGTNWSAVPSASAPVSGNNFPEMTSAGGTALELWFVGGNPRWYEYQGGNWVAH